MRPPAWLVVVLLGALVGIVFAGVSTYDFVQHLDRQVHSLHCSFIPGMSHGAGESGCQIAMMSPYSSVLRAHVWGGIPIALPAMAVFAFIAFYGLDLLVARRVEEPRATGFLALAAALPAVTSIVMLSISLAKLGTTCKLCVCIYVASAMCLAGGIGLWRRAVAITAGRIPRAVARVRRGSSSGSSSSSDASESGSGASSLQPATSNQFLAVMFAVGVAFVGVPLAIYVAMAPDHSKFLGTCENLVRSDDPYGVMVHVDRTAAARAIPALEILDPLCPACRAFEQRLQSSGLADRLDRKAILFPLDTQCNWMISETTHPGACTVSEAVLCAGERAPEVIAWAFEVQDRVRAEAKADPTAAARIVKQRFPELAACVGSADARSRLNKSMRWTVAHNIRVLTPQLFVDNIKLCDEDVDLGLEYALTRMLDAHDRGVRLGPPPAELPATTPSPAHPEKSDRPATETPPTAKPADQPARAIVPPVDEPARTKPPAEDKLPPAAGSDSLPAEDKPVTSPGGDTPPAKPADPPPQEPAPAGSSGGTP